MKKSPPTIKLSIITVNYNSTTLLLDLISSIQSSNLPINYEHIVVDNGSTEDTSALQKNSHITYVQSTNLGFSHGNNLGVKKALGEYIWFMNPDTTVEPTTIMYMLEYIEAHPDVGIASPKLVLPDGSFDKNGHRGFPSIWNSLCHFVLLDKLFPTSKLFAGYYLGHLPIDTTTEVDVVGGSSVLMPKRVGDKVGWWDEDYFMYGEDIDLAYRVKQAGFKVMFVPGVYMHHYHGASSGLKKSSSAVTTANRETKLRSVKSSTDAMRIFYAKHYAVKHHPVITSLVYFGIWVLEQIRMLTSL